MRLLCVLLRRIRLAVHSLIQHVRLPDQVRSLCLYRHLTVAPQRVSDQYRFRSCMIPCFQLRTPSTRLRPGQTCFFLRGLWFCAQSYLRSTIAALVNGLSRHPGDREVRCAGAHLLALRHL